MNITEHLKREAALDRACGVYVPTSLCAPDPNYRNARRYKNSAEVDAGNVRLVVHGERVEAEPQAAGYFDVQAVMCGGQDILDLLDAKMVQLLADRAYWGMK